MTRITELSMANSTLAGLQASLQRVQDLQSQASSGKRIQVASDDPQGAAISLQLRDQKLTNDQYARNGDFANSRLNVIDNSLQQLSSQIQAARSAVVSSIDGVRSATSNAALSAAVSQVKSAITGLYNTQYLGRPVFGGTSASGLAVDSSGTYVGDGNPVTVQLSDSQTVRVDVDGSLVAADTLPAALDDMATRAATSGGVTQSDLDTLDDALTKVSTALGIVGAAENKVTTTANQVSSNSADLTNSIAQNEDADLAEVLTKFASQQVAYQTAVGVAAKIEQVSLLDFLR